MVTRGVAPMFVVELCRGDCAEEPGAFTRVFAVIRLRWTGTGGRVGRISWWEIVAKLQTSYKRLDLLSLLAAKDQGKVAPVAGASIVWKGKSLRIPCSPDDSILASAPHPELARFLAGLLVDLRRMPTVPPCGYEHAQRIAAVASMPAVFRLLGAIQEWCRGNSLFDLSAVIVTSAELVPGAGRYGVDCEDRDEWSAYMEAAIAALSARAEA